MKSIRVITEVTNEALKKYAANLELIEQYVEDITILNKRIENLEIQNEYICIHGELEQFSSDDIPF